MAADETPLLFSSPYPWPTYPSVLTPAACLSFNSSSPIPGGAFLVQSHPFPALAARAAHIKQPPSLPIHPGAGAALVLLLFFTFPVICSSAILWGEMPLQGRRHFIHSQRFLKPSSA